MTDQPLVEPKAYMNVDELLEQSARICCEWDKVKEFLIAAEGSTGETANAYRAIARDAYWKMEVSWNRMLQRMMPTMAAVKDLAHKDKMPDAVLEPNPLEAAHWEEFQRKAEALSAERAEEEAELQKRLEQSASDTGVVGR